MANLTNQQNQAVIDRGGKLLVSAAAGSGKTMVLVERLMRYILDPIDPANIDDFLIITYTKAAAAELREKIAKKLNELLAEDSSNRHLQNQLQRLYLAKISTVHGFCTDILRENAYRLDIPGDFRVAEEDECLELQTLVLDQLLEEAYSTIEEDIDFRKVVDTQGFGRDDRKLPEVILQIYHSAQCHRDPDSWLEKCALDSEISNITDAAQTPWGDYLIQDLHSCLDLYIAAIGKCTDAARNADGMKSATALLEMTVAHMEAMRACNTWQEIHDNRFLQFGRMTFEKDADPELKERIKAVRDACKNALQEKQAVFAYDNEQILTELRDSVPVVRGLVDLVHRFAAQYDKRKQSRRILDFADLEHKTLDLLWGKHRTGITSIALEIGARFREVMVDEYQDSNAVQDAIFSALTEKRQNCFMVGDVKQSIYQFRLADPDIFLQKYNSYLPADEATAGQGRKVLLSKNFRSSDGVIRAVNDVFSVCMSPKIGGLVYGTDERLNGDESKLPLPDPVVSFYGITVNHDTYAEEATFVAKKIRQMIDEGCLVQGENGLRPVVPEDFAIILRSPGSVGGEFAYALERVGLRCNFGGDQNILQLEEVQFLRSLLCVVDNPLQDIPLVAVMMSRVFGFSADDMASIRKKATYCPIFQLLEREQDGKPAEFCRMLKELRTYARLCTVSDLIVKILALTRTDSIFAAINDSTDSIEAFIQLATQAEQAGHRDLGSFLKYLSALEERGVPAAQNNRAQGMVTILSIHKSKGLEYPVVFLSGLSKGFNREDLKEQVLCDRSLGLGVTYVDGRKRLRYPTIAKRAIMLKKTSDSLSEELRVLYVAMTRARDRLIMTYASKYMENAVVKCTSRMDYSGDVLMAKEVSSMGEWVLQAALRRIEAGELFAIGGRPETVTTYPSCWKIAVVQGNDEINDDREAPPEVKAKIDASTKSRLRTSLSFQYPFASATTFPSKQTATQLKGRLKDQEASQDAPEHKRFYAWRKPTFIENKTDPLAIGTATHKALQFLRLTQQPSESDLDAELSALCKQGRLTEQDLSLIDKKALSTFYHSPLGHLLMQSENVLREFKFSILVKGTDFDKDLTDDRVLLQGVVDCAIVDDDGITVIDFKTDAVTDDTVLKVADGYRLQVKAYADALSRIYCLPIKRAVLYFLRVGKEVDIH